MTKDYLFDHEIKGIKERRIEKFENMSLDYFKKEYERLCIALNALMEAEFFIENTGWFRDEDDNRATTYSGVAKSLIAQECYYKSRANARPNTCTALNDCKIMISHTVQNLFGWDATRELDAIDKVYREKFSQFFKDNKDNQ